MVWGSAPFAPLSLRPYPPGSATGYVQPCAKQPKTKPQRQSVDHSWKVLCFM